MIFTNLEISFILIWSFDFLNWSFDFLHSWSFILYLFGLSYLELYLSGALIFTYVIAWSFDFYLLAL